MKDWKGELISGICLTIVWLFLIAALLLGVGFPV